MNAMTFFAVLTLASGGWFGGTRGSGKIKEEVRTVEAFQSVQCGAGIDGDITLGSPASVKVVADDNLVPIIKTTVERGLLRVGVESGHHGFSSKNPVKVVIVMPQLVGAEATGGSGIAVHGNVQGKLELASSGGGSIGLDRVALDSVEISTSGGGSVTIKGSAKVTNIEASGGAEVHARELTTDALDLDASGGAEIEIKATRAVKASLSGGCTAEIAGRPEHRQVHESGGSEVHFVDEG